MENEEVERMLLEWKIFRKFCGSLWTKKKSIYFTNGRKKFHHSMCALFVKNEEWEIFDKKLSRCSIKVIIICGKER